MHKIALDIGGLQVHWYGVLVAGGFLAGLWTASRRGLRSNFAPDAIMDLGTWLILGAVIGARTLYVVSYWREAFANKPISEIFMVHHGGLVFYGGLMGSSLACIIYTRWKKLPLWKVADVMAPSIALGHFFGRIGCLMNGCCYGRECALPWAVHFPPDHETHGAGVHPTQIYESLLNFCLYATLAWLFRRKTFDGQVFAVYLMAYAFLRSFVELFRGDYQTHYIFGWVTPAHLVSIGILVTGAILFAVLPRPQPDAKAAS